MNDYMPTNRRWTTVVLVFFFFAGVSVMLYPGISNYINEKHSSRVLEGYNDIADGMSEQEQADYLAAAEDYNRRLYEMPLAFYDPERVEGYETTLNVMGNGVIGYLNIERIRVELPIYHGVSDEVLSVAVGHLKGTSLPVGGENTHSVISAHRGLPGATLFTNLDQLEKGDIFTITVLNRVVTYEVDQIRIVEPDEPAELQIIPGGDYCTLLTCTPYGINTQRLLVRGKRIENIREKPVYYITADAYQIEPVLAAPAVAAPMLLVLLIRLMLPKKKQKKPSVSDFWSEDV